MVRGSHKDSLSTFRRANMHYFSADWQIYLNRSPTFNERVVGSIPHRLHLRFPSAGWGQVQEVSQQLRPFHRQKALRVELHAVQGPSLVADAHDLPFRGPRGHFEVGVCPRFFFDDQRVVTRRVERIAEAGEDASAIVVDRRNFPVHDPGVADDLAAEGMADALMPEADAEDRYRRREFLKYIVGNPGFLRRARPRRDDDVRRRDRPDLGEAEPVVAVHLHRQTWVDLPEPLDEVVGEGVVVIDEEDHGSQGAKRFAES